MAPSACLICNKSPAKDCASCKSARYCSRECQQLDWPLHKTLCKKIAKLSSRPTTPSKLGILLSADDPDPRFVWVPCPKAVLPQSSTRFDSPVVEHLLGDPITHAAERFNVGKNEVRGYELDHTVVLHARDNWLNDGSKPNQAALALTDWKLPYDWRGNILIMSYKGMVGKNVAAAPDVKDALAFLLQEEGERLEPFQDYQDITLGDLRTAVDYLSRYGMHIQRGQEHPALNITKAGEDEKTSELQKLFAKMAAGEKKKKVKGVMIRCEGDIGLYRKQTGRWERYSEVEVSKDHAIWKESPTDSSKIMGLPLLVYRLPESSAWDKNDHTRFDNQPATFLNLSLNPQMAGRWGFALPEWQTNVGSVLLVRKDGKDLSREQGWALAEYLQFQVSDSLEAAMESGEERQRRAAVLKMLNWKRFDTWLENFKVEMTTADRNSWSDVRSPFGTKEGSRGQPL